MLVIRNLFQLVWGKNETVEEENDPPSNVGAIIDSIIQREEIINIDKVINVPKTEFSTAHRMGTVTKLLTNTGIIDNRYQFEMHMCINSSELEVGRKVTYAAFRRNEDEEWRVTKIINVHQDDWCEEECVTSDSIVAEPEDIAIVPAEIHHIVGWVVARKNREVTVVDTIQIVGQGNSSRETIFSLDNVSSNYLPQEGDLVRLQVIYEVDENVQNLNGDIVRVLSIRPERERTDSAVVTVWKRKEKQGEIDGVFFDIHACTSGYFPKVGDTVMVEAIEAKRQGKDGWRAISVEPVDLRPDFGGNIAQKKKTLPPRIDPELARNKNNIVVSDDINLGLISYGEDTEFHVYVSNNGRTPRTVKVTLKSGYSEKQIKLLSHQQVQSLHPGQTIDYLFCCHPSCYGFSDDVVIFDFKSFTIGRLISWEVVFEEFPADVSIAVPSQKFDVNAYKATRLELAAAQRSQAQNILFRVPGVRPFVSPNFVPVRMDQFKIPQHFQDIVLDEKNVNNISDQIKALKASFPCLFGPLSRENYKDRFHYLLYLLELDAKLDVGRYNMKRQSFNRTGAGGEFLSLVVEGLAEKRPSVLVGDSVTAFCSSQREYSAPFQGYVHRVLKNELWLKFHDQFHLDYHGEDYDIVFELSRGTYRKCHYAVNLCLSRQALLWLFPDAVHSKPPQILFEELESELTIFNGVKLNLETEREKSSENNRKTSSGSSQCELIRKLTNKPASPVASSPPAKTNGTSTSNDKLQNKRNGLHDVKQLKWVNPRLNARQQDAVRNILRGEGRPLPFIIFGPPGTGKTVTLVEAILQTFLMRPDSRIIVATPSNSSADLIAERLLDSGKIQPGELVRIVAHHLVVDQKVPVKLQRFSASIDINSNAPKQPQATSYGIPMCSGEVLGRHRISVGTCVTLGQLHSFNFRPGHFSHIFVDEAGQATEPEILIPLGFVSLGHTQSVLAGDPLQLGPVVPSKLAARLGLSISFLARLLERFPYKRDPNGFDETGGYDPRLVTRLNVNYRSLPDILELPSSLFYDGELEPKIQNVDSLEANFLKMLTASAGLPHFPVIFQGVRGSNAVDSDSPSWFNMQEIYQVLCYMRKLTEYKVDPIDIGIITPYQKQAQKLRYYFEKLDLPIPKIGSVEEFQGQERLVIVVSTVRSNKEMVSRDIVHSLGFVSCKERLNVAITRARALLIIIGDPYILSCDPYWRTVLEYCIDHESYVGCSLSSELWERESSHDT